MGRGDRRTRKGKIARGSYGNARPQKTETTAPKAKVLATKKEEETSKKEEKEEKS